LAPGRTGSLESSPRRGLTPVAGRPAADDRQLESIEEAVAMQRALAELLEASDQAVAAARDGG
jgi:hypothetical protein